MGVRVKWIYECMREVWNKALNDYQREATTQFVNKKTDLFINLPSGYGKLGISAVFLSDIKDEEIKEVDEGCFSLL